MNERSPVHDRNGDTVPLRQYIERILDERDKAVQVAYRNMEQRLDRLNALRAEVQEDRGQFVRLDAYEEKHENLRTRIEHLERTGAKSDVLATQAAEVARTRRTLFITIVAGAFLTGVNLVINFLQSGGRLP